MLEQIKKDLPNFPDEVIKDWLEPYGRDIGWPPTHDRWLGILFAKDLDFWKNVQWKKRTLDLTNISFTATSGSIIIGLHDAAALGKQNIYSDLENSKGRHFRVLIHLLKHGTFPTPVCLLKEGDNYSVVDGNHRVTAFKSYWTLCELYRKDPPEFKDLAETFKKKWNIEPPVNFSAQHDVWVATSTI